MSTLTLPQARIAIGSVMVQGQRLPVEIDMEWMRYFTVLSDRAGGIVAPTNLYTTINQLPQSAVVLDSQEEGEPGPMGPPGLQGPMGPMGISIPGMDGEDGEAGIFMFAPSPYRTPLDATRALNTTYTNTSAEPLLVMATVRCAITVAAGNAYVQAKMDTATPPTVAASGIIGIQAGLLGEDNSFQVAFIVNPGGTYILISTTTNGTATLGKWFEFPL
jgi:hypothetical protein